jgi:ABC-type uncharacterized transport system substrate-binding protein
MQLWRGAFALLTGLALTVGPAAAHPHVWVTMTSEIVYAADGAVTGVRHAWVFDDMFSTFALQGIETKQKGMYTRDELAPLAEVNMTSLKDFEYFTSAKADGKEAPFDEPKDYWLDYKDSVLTLHFTLPFKTPVKTAALDLEIYDPTYFVDFSFAKDKPVTLVGAPAACKLAVAKPQEPAAAGVRLSESFFNQPAASANFGAQFANKLTVKCQ